MAGVQEQYRQRIAVFLLLLGISLVLTGIAFIVHHQQTMDAGQAPMAVKLPPDAKLRVAKTIREVLFAILVLVGIFAVSTFAFLRWSRHFRRQILRKPRPATPSDDVWAMYRLPDDEDSDTNADQTKPGNGPAD